MERGCCSGVQMRGTGIYSALIVEKSDIFYEIRNQHRE